MQLLCNGQYVELKGARLSFKRSNILFAFDSIECERSLSFDIPDTPNNDKLFRLAKEPAFAGGGMRIRYDAELQDGTVVRKGYLHITQYAKGAYKAIFVTGELLGLQSIRNAGKVSDILSPDDVIAWQASGTSYLRDELYRQYAYKRKNGSPFGSVRLYSLLTDSLDAIGASYVLPTGDDQLSYARIVPSEQKGFKEQAVNYQLHCISNPTASNPILNTISIAEAATILDTITANVALRQEIGMTITMLYGQVRQFKANQELTLVFPEDWDDNLFIGKFLNGGSQSIAEFEFYGDRSFDADGNVTGDSLRGRSVTVEAGELFCIISKDCYYKGTDSGGAYYEGWFYMMNGQTIEGEPTMSGEITDLGQTVRLADNLPELTVVELLKIAAAISGRILYYTNSTVRLVNLDFSTWSVVDYTDSLLSVEQLQRTFADYGQRNDVVFDSGTWVREGSKVRVEYTVPNANIDAVHVLQKLPMSEGNREGIFAEQTEDAQMLAYAANGQPYMLQVSLPKNSNLQSLCTASTSLSVKLHMPLQEWEGLKPQILIQLRGKRYVWTEGTWQQGVATLKLSQI